MRSMSEKFCISKLFLKALNIILNRYNITQADSFMLSSSCNQEAFGLIAGCLWYSSFDGKDGASKSDPE